jgi:spore germination protein KB
MRQIILDNGKISAHQFKVLITLSFIGTSVLNAPGLFAEKAKQAAWISAILSVALGLILILFYNAVANRLENKTFIEYTKKLLGKWVGSFICLSFVSFLFLNSTALVWIVGNFLTTQLLTDTPMLVVNVVFIIVIIIATLLGLETIARTAEILYPWAVGGFILLVLFALPDAEVKNLQPIFGEGIKPIIQAAVLFQAFNPLTFVISLMILPSRVTNLQETKKAFLKGILTGGIIVIILTFVCILVLGADTTVRRVYPSYALAKNISIGNFLERIESILGMVWIVTIFFKTNLYFYVTVEGFAQTLGLKDYKPFTLPIGMLVIIFSGIVYPNTVYAANWDKTTWFSYALTYGFIFPLFIFIIGKLRHKKISSIES